MISRIALAVAAGMLVGGAVAPAMAADLGGGCCGDLEERVAELEATVARKGNRVVSLQIYGDITQGILFFDNGKDSDAYVVDNDALGSVLGFKGEAQLKPGLKAGYKLEMAVQAGGSSSSAVTEEANGDDKPDNFSIRHNFLYIESERYGRISLGQTSTASDGAAQVTIGNTLVVGSPDWGTSLTPGGIGDGRLKLGEFASDFDGGRNDVIRYDSPSIYGFVLSAAWGDNDYWDIALRFSKEFNSVKLAAAIAYADDSTGEGVSIVPGGNSSIEANVVATDFTQVIGSVAVMHVPTGLFAHFAAGERDYKVTDVTGSFFFVQAGIERKWLPYGTTTFYGEYATYQDVVTKGTDADMWGLGVVQHIDAAAMDVYAQARFYDIQDDFNDNAEETSVIMLGSRIQF
jgi:predicted porin